jgi:adenylate cyclase
VAEEEAGQERRMVTVLFADIAGSTRLASRLDPERFREVLAAFYRLASDELASLRGRAEKFVGDAVMAVFGAPVPSSDHADRAVAAALAMHAAQDAVNAKWAETGLTPFGLGIGLSTGPAAAALLGSEERLEYTLVGDTVNLSARLQQLAEAGETVLSAATVAALATPVDAVELEPQLVKGRDTPVLASKILSKQGVRP